VQVFKVHGEQPLLPQIATVCLDIEETTRWETGLAAMRVDPRRALHTFAKLPVESWMSKASSNTPFGTSGPRRSAVHLF